MKTNNSLKWWKEYLRHQWQEHELGLWPFLMKWKESKMEDWWEEKQEFLFEREKSEWGSVCLCCVICGFICVCLETVLPRYEEWNDTSVSRLRNGFGGKALMSLGILSLSSPDTPKRKRTRIRYVLNIDTSQILSDTYPRSVWLK